MSKSGIRVVAMHSFKDGVLKIYGEGIYLGEAIPNDPFFESYQIANPCILLDNKRLVWGCQCWWGEKERFYKKYEGHIKETIIITEPYMKISRLSLFTSKYTIKRWLFNDPERIWVALDKEHPFLLANTRSEGISIFDDHLVYWENAKVNSCVKHKLPRTKEELYSIYRKA